MKILVIECTAEELKANRTVMDTVNEVLNNFTDSLCGVNNIDFVKAMAESAKENEPICEDCQLFGTVDCAYTSKEPTRNDKACEYFIGE